MAGLHHPFAVAPGDGDRVESGLLHVDSVAVAADSQSPLHGELLTLHADGGSRR